MKQNSKWISILHYNVVMYYLFQIIYFSFSIISIISSIIII